MTDPRTVLIAPDSFKGSLTSVEVAQALAEGVTLLTADAKVAEYGGPVLKV